VLVESAGLVHEGMWDMIEMLRIEKEADVRRFFGTVMHKTPFALGLMSREVASMFRSPAVVNFIGANNREDIIWDEELANVRAQTHILWGEDDGLIPPILAHRWHAGIPRSSLKWIPRCGHAPQFERPVLFEKMLEQALGHPPLQDAVRSRVASHLPPWLGRRVSKA
jgi:pimeloyl-ACP methyl ester carboxylesterase